MAEFADLRAQVPIERVFVEMLGVTDFKPSGTKQKIGTCPVCGARALKITPEMGLSNCLRKGCAMGGDIIKAVARVRKLSITEAGNAIETHFGLQTARPVNKPVTHAPFDPQAYQAKLDPEHDALATLKISSGIIREFGGGYCAKGKLGGYLALPIHEGAKIVSFFGVPLDDGDIKFGRDEDRSAIFNASGLEVQPTLSVVRDPLPVLRAAENGDNQVIAVLSGSYTPDSLRKIAAVMEANQIEEAELF